MNNNDLYTIEEAIKQLLKNHKSKHDTVEVHINLGLDVKKADQSIRTTLVLPHGTGKTPKIAVFSDKTEPKADINLTESDLEKIENNQLKPKEDFDLIIVHPSYMPKIAKIAKILGPKGLMPNPKNGTVTENVSETIEEFKKGKIEIKTEQNFPIIHTVIGKTSFGETKLIENFNSLINAIKTCKPPKIKPEDYIKSVYICTTMGKSYKIALN